MRILLFVLFLALGATTAAALEFRLLSWDGEVIDLRYSDGTQSVPVVAYENLLSPVYLWTGPGPLVLFRETTIEGRTVRTPVATVSPPEGFTHAILLLVATDMTRTGYTGTWINDSLEARPLQTITYQNLSSYTVTIRLGEQEFTVPPKSASTQRTDNTVQRMVLKAAAQTETGWELIASTSHTARPGRRTLVVLRDGRVQPNGHKDRIDFLIFNDRPPAPPSTAP